LFSKFAQSFDIPGLRPFRCRDFDGYQHLEKEQQTIQIRKTSFISIRKEHVGLKQLFVHSKSAQQSAIIPGNENVTSIAQN
jgi:8-amino-7-oxononanoate synthase